MSKQHEPYTRDEAIAELDRLLLHGFGALTIKVNEHSIPEVELLLRKRKAARANG